MRAQVSGNELDNVATGIYYEQSLYDSETMEEVWLFLTGPFIDVMFAADATTPAAGVGNFTPPSRYLYGVDAVLGGVRIGQIRLQQGQCNAVSGFKTMSGQPAQFPCYGNSGAYSAEWEDKAPFGSGPKQFTWEGWNTSHFSIQQERDFSLNAAGTRTSTGEVFPAVGYTVVLPSDADAARETMLNLQNWGYVDEATRFLSVEFTVYNAMVDVAVVGAVFVEIPAGGSVVPQYDSHTTRLYNLTTSRTTRSVVLEVLVCIYFIVYAILAVVRAKQYGVRYYFGIIKSLHVLNIVLFFLGWVFRFMSLTAAPDADSVIVDSDIFYNFRPAATYNLISVYFTAFNAFLVWLRLLEYVSKITGGDLILDTLQRAGAPMLHFTLVFAMVFYGFATAFSATFGSKVEGYRNLTQSAFSLLKALLGDMNFDEMKIAQWFMAPLLTIVFLAVAVFIILQILLAIVLEAYEEVRQQTDKQPSIRLIDEFRLYLLDRIHRVPRVGPRLELWLRPWLHPRAASGQTARLRRLLSKLDTGTTRGVVNSLRKATKAGRNSVFRSSGASSGASPGKAGSVSGPLAVAEQTPDAAAGNIAPQASGRHSEAEHPPSTSREVDTTTTGSWAPYRSGSVRSSVRGKVEMTHYSPSLPAPDESKQEEGPEWRADSDSGDSKHNE